MKYKGEQVVLGKGTVVLNVVRMSLIEKMTFDKSPQVEERASADSMK